MKQLHLDDEKIHRLLLKGKQTALEQIIEAYGPCVYQLVTLILQGLADPGSVEECCADVFVKVWEKRARFDPARGSLRTWVLILARYRALDYRRKFSRRNHIEMCSLNPHPSLAGDPAAGSNPETCCLQTEQRSEIMSALAALPESDREILYRRYFLEEPIGRIALKMGITRSAADNRLWRARRVLKERLAETSEKEVIPCNE